MLSEKNKNCFSAVLQDLQFLKADLYWLPRILLELLVLAVLLFLLVTNAHAQELNSKEHYFLVQKFPTQDNETSLYVLPLEITQPRISDCLYPKKITYGKDPVYQLSCQNGDVYVVMSIGLRVAKNLFPEFFLERGKIPPFKLEKVRPIKNA